MPRRKPPIEGGAHVHAEGIGILRVNSFVHEPCYILEGENGIKHQVPARQVRKLTVQEQIDFWKTRAVEAEGKLATPKSLTVPIDDDESWYVAVCSQCNVTQEFAEEADAATEMDKKGWKFIDGNPVCPACAPER